jgi:predicted small lipoprotein YifL
MARLLVAVVLCLALAGCGQWTPLGGPTPERATQVPLEQTPGEQPGIRDDGVNAALLVTRHEQVLQTTNYTLDVTQRTNGTGHGVLRRTNWYREVADSDRQYWGFVRYNASVNALQEFGTTDYWRNRTHVATRFDSPLRPTRASLWKTDSSGPLPSPSNPDTLRTLLSATDPAVAQRRSDGTVVLSGEQPYPRAVIDTPPQLTDVRNVSGRFRIRDDGVIVAWRVAYDATFVRDRVRVVRTGTVSDIGETTVERPPWVANATRLDTRP